MKWHVETVINENKDKLNFASRLITSYFTHMLLILSTNKHLLLPFITPSKEKQET